LNRKYLGVRFILIKIELIMMKKIRDKKGVMKNDSAFQPSLEKKAEGQVCHLFPAYRQRVS